MKKKRKKYDRAPAWAEHQDLNEIKNLEDQLKKMEEDFDKMWKKAQAEDRRKKIAK